MQDHTISKYLHFPLLILSYRPKMRTTQAVITSCTTNVVRKDASTHHLDGNTCCEQIEIFDKIRSNKVLPKLIIGKNKHYYF